MIDIDEETPAPETPAPAPAPATDTAELESLIISEAEYTPGAEAAAKDEDENPATSEMIAVVLGPAFDVLAPNWNVTAPEVEALADVYGRLIDHYFPDLEAGPVGSAFIVTAMIAIPRLGTPARIADDPDPDPDQVASNGD